MRKAIILPIHLKFNQPDDLPFSEGLNLAKRAIESLRILEDQDFTLILPVCFDLKGRDEEDPLIEMDRLIRKELKDLGLKRMLIFTSQQLQPLRQYLVKRNLKN